MPTTFSYLFKVKTQTGLITIHDAKDGCSVHGFVNSGSSFAVGLEAERELARGIMFLILANMVILGVEAVCPAP